MTYYAFEPVDHAKLDMVDILLSCYPLPLLFQSTLRGDAITAYILQIHSFDGISWMCCDHLRDSFAGLEATATFQSDGAPDLWRALSLLSTNKSRSPPITGYANDARPEQPLLQVLPFESRSDGGRQLQESLLFKPFFGTGFVDTSHLS